MHAGSKIVFEYIIVSLKAVTADFRGVDITTCADVLHRTTV